jgi:hypothetical protein
MDDLGGTLEAAVADINHFAQARVTPEQITAALVPVQRAQAALEAAIETRATPGQITEALVPVRDRQAALEAAIEPLATREHVTEALAQVQAALEARVTPDQMAEALDETVGAVRDSLLERYEAAEPWARGGAGYQAFALVTHRGGLWQSLAHRNHEEPDTLSPIWMLVSDSIESAELVRCAEGLVLRVRRTSGAETSALVRDPVPTFRGVYDPATRYNAWDTVAKDSHVFLCLRDGAGAPGATAGEWQVFSGPRGKKGVDGKSPAPVNEDAIVDRVMREVVPQLQQVVDTL